MAQRWEPVTQGWKRWLVGGRVGKNSYQNPWNQIKLMQRIPLHIVREGDKERGAPLLLDTHDNINFKSVKMIMFPLYTEVSVR
jgi:hypothetical protein